MAAERKEKRAMRQAITGVGLILLMGSAGMGAEFTSAQTHRTTDLGAEPASMKQGESPFQYCSRVGTDDDPGDVPASLTAAFARAFDVRMTPIEIQGSSRFRCYRGRVMGCMSGANLNCGKADTGKTSQGGNEWCRSRPNDSMIPMAATGHATIYFWRCSGTRAVPAKVISKVDDRGFELMNWKPLN